MRNLKRFLLRFMTVSFVLTVHTAASFGQSIVQLSIFDLKHDSALSDVTVTFSSAKILFIGTSDSIGQVRTAISGDGKITIVASKPGFIPFERQVILSADTLDLVIRMRAEKTLQLKEIVVKAPGAVDTVFSSERLHVQDFEILNDGNLILLTYPKRLKKGAELVLFDGLRVLHSLPVIGQAERLEKDYQGNVQVICKDRVYTILSVRGNLEIAQMERDYYFRYIAPILDTNGEQLYFNDFNTHYPEFSYWKLNQKDSLYDKFRTIRDDLMMELYRSEYKWVDIRIKLWAKNLEYETGIDAEIWVGANYFTQSIYYKELYAPFFKVNQELFVFDYYRDQLYVHDTLGVLLRTTPISHHLNKKSTGWKSYLFQDRATDEVYTFYEKFGNSYVAKIDLETGQVPAHYQLNFKYVENIQVHDGFVYYIYRPFESSQKKYVYKEKLALDSSEMN